MECVWPWTERAFSFDFPVEKFPDLVERARGTPARVERLVSHADRSVLSQSDGRGWSILENLGHLVDLGYLPATRVDEILAGKDVLVAADISNRTTNEAGHNGRSLEDLLGVFRLERGALIDRLESLSRAQWGMSALHPRIKQPMRIVDIVYFDSEHDDYHLARIRRLLGHFGQRAGC